MGAPGCTEHQPSEAHADLSPGEAQPIAFPCADSVVPTAWAGRGAGGGMGGISGDLSGDALDCHGGGEDSVCYWHPAGRGQQCC